MFNLLKLDYKSRNIYTFDEMVFRLDANSQVSAREIKLCEFLNLYTVFIQYYWLLKSEETSQTHVFSIPSNKYGRKPTVWVKQDDGNAIERIDNLLPTQRNKMAKYQDPVERKEKIRGLMSELLACESPCIPEIKQVEIFTEWRPLLPPYAKDITYPQPSDTVVQKIKDKQNTKWQKKEQEKGLESGKNWTIVKNDYSSSHSPFVKKNDNVIIIYWFF